VSILVRFNPAGLTSAQHDQVGDQLRESGDWPPEGLQLHVAFGEDGHLLVSEIWQSEEQMRAFGEKLMPVLQQLGVQLSGDPQIYPVHELEQH
jgi:hypothetical protein